MNWSAHKAAKRVRYLLAALLLGLGASFARAETIPLGHSGDLYTIPVLVNGAVILPFIIDSGASEVSIPTDVFLTLSRTRTVKPSDYIGFRTFTLANGMTEREPVIRLRTVTVGHYTVRDVSASISPVTAEPLLSQSALSRLPKWTIDNQRNSLVLNESPGPTAPATAWRRPFLYLDGRLNSPAYMGAFEALFRAQKDLPLWLEGFLGERNGVEHPGQMVARGRYELYAVCQPHNCAGNFLYALFRAGGGTAWALLIKRGAVVRFFGHPGKEERALLTAAWQQRLRGVPIGDE